MRQVSRNRWWRRRGRQGHRSRTRPWPSLRLLLSRLPPRFKVLPTLLIMLVTIVLLRSPACLILRTPATLGMSRLTATRLFSLRLTHRAFALAPSPRPFATPLLTQSIIMPLNLILLCCIKGAIPHLTSKAISAALATIDFASDVQLFTDSLLTILASPGKTCLESAWRCQTSH